jgi:SAM-dependent methyltransferase
MRSTIGADVLTVDYGRLRLQAGERLLDIGCGFGRHTYEAVKRGASVVACDLGVSALEGVRSIVGAMALDDEIPDGVAFVAVNGDATALPFPDNSFERVIASEVVEHITDDVRAFSELARVLRPGGMLAVTVPAWFSERLCWALSDEYPAPRSPGGHVRIYSRASLRERLYHAALEPTAAHHAHALHSPYWWLRCAVGPHRPIETNRVVDAYHRLLCWEIEKQPGSLRLFGRLLDPLIGKSLVMYACKPGNLAHHALTSRRTPPSTAAKDVVDAVA